jgi:hypothetical protein
MFENRKLVIATKHNKERVIAPLVLQYLGIADLQSSEFDTDSLGTFSGEIVRKDDSITTVRNKCIQAMELANCDLGIANEGSFGNHPTLFFSTADEEFMIFIDRKNNLEIIERIISVETNYCQEEITTEAELNDFLQKVQFPSHAVILRKSSEDHSELYKGLQDKEEVLSLCNDFWKKYGKVTIETDMRAMYNPTRMQVIEQLTEKLMQKITSTCPSCNTPGFSVTKAIPGLPCESCFAPTKSTLSYILTCTSCLHSEEKMYPHGKKSEDPMYCDFCNP